MPLPSAELAAIRREITPASVGMDEDAYEAHLKYLRTLAEARLDATPEQQAAGIRYALYGLWVRSYGTSAESLRSASGSSITKGKGDGLAAIRAEWQRQGVLSGLAPASSRPRSTSVSVEVVL